MYPYIPELSKPADFPCGHIRKGRPDGCCSIHKVRPTSCRGFSCVWLTDPGMPEEFRPDRCGIMLAAREDTPGQIQIWELDHEFTNSKLEAWITMQPVVNYSFMRVRKCGGIEMGEEEQEARDDQ